MKFLDGEKLVINHNKIKNIKYNTVDLSIDVSMIDFDKSPQETNIYLNNTIKELLNKEILCYKTPVFIRVTLENVDTPELFNYIGLEIKTILQKYLTSTNKRKYRLSRMFLQNLYNEGLADFDMIDMANLLKFKPKIKLFNFKIQTCDFKMTYQLIPNEE